MKKTKKVVLELEYYEDKSNPSEKIYRWGPVSPDKLNLDILTYLDINWKYITHIKWDKNSLREFWKYLINLSEYKTIDPDYHEHFDELDWLKWNTNLIIHHYESNWNLVDNLLERNKIECFGYLENILWEKQEILEVFNTLLNTWKITCEYVKKYLKIDCIKNGTIYWDEDLDIRWVDIEVQIRVLDMIRGWEIKVWGLVYFWWEVENVEKITKKEEIPWDLYLEWDNIETLGRIRKIEWSLYLEWIKNLKDIWDLEEVWWDLDIEWANVKRIWRLKKVWWYLYLRWLNKETQKEIVRKIEKWKLKVEGRLITDL